MLRCSESVKGFWLRSPGPIDGPGCYIDAFINFAATCGTIAFP